ncbi:hypothetical protein [Mucisphaera calidilacus]|uniref:Uncharacterized protein n=1 Tax=Mucisphaera calidilacus TaxID=2527982 RepID=A0A518BTD6_9BACT|nr:hypothetical protein [Mucisphaera calidilacus]QDU70234.1 hypothetical protein Pan265_00560 [Mucisphaera calidilacus]
MDDARTRQALDELAEVFLTGTSNDQTAPEPTQASPTQPHPTELRLSGTEPDDQPVSDRPPVGREAVILGNLPGLGDAWLGQYAQHLADEHGPVALLHLDHDAIDLEVIGEQQTSRPPGRIPPANRERDDLTQALDELALDDNSPVARLLVHVQPYADGEIQIQAVARLAALDRWTLLCGADDAAIVACYRMLKHLLEATDQPGPRRIGLMILGSSEIEGLEAARKVQAAAQSHMNRPIDLVGSLARMRPVHTRPVGRFTPVDRMWLRLRGWLDDLEHDELPETTSDTTRGDTAMTQAQPAADTPTTTSQHADDDLDLDLSAEQAVAGRTARSRIGELAQPIAESAATSTAAPAAETAEPDPIALMIDNPDLGLHDAIRLDAVCPHQPDVAMLLDAHGRLHLVRTHRRAPRSAVADNTHTDLPALHQALLDLADARRWARQHLQLLQLTQRQCRFDPDARPVMHLATERADLGLELTQRLGNALRLHLLQHVRLGDVSGWHLTPLS